MMEAMDMLKDPAVQKEVQQMMADPQFKAQMEQMKENPKFKAAMERAAGDIEQMGNVSDQLLDISSILLSSVVGCFRHFTTA
jgi:predicted glycosyl hydrolase (DUF1957 family)